MYWSMFEMTGSVLAYLLYRHYLKLNGRTQGARDN
ncbi:MAG TPA: YqzL family protein [Firmicutes bacterium]|nr:YqzL family protein [Candidatus Fermentithermobacillaceae bacterium]